MAALWFMAGVCFTLTFIILLLPWLRTIPRLGSLPVLPWQVGIAAVAAAGAVFGLCLWLQPTNPAVAPAGAAAARNGSVPAPASGAATDQWAGIADALGRGAGPMSSPTQPASSGSAPNGSALNGSTKAAASPMNSAIASLQARLAKNGGSADDWELLAKSYEFLGQPAEAAKARAHQLPDLPASDGASANVPAPGSTGTAGAAATSSAAAATGAAVSGEVALAPTLKAKAAAGATLFIFAKSVDSPGPPVAVYRTTVGSWPVKFKLDDSESMLPGRNLSSARRVMVEARISRSGQPLAAAGDLQGTTGVIETADRKPLTVLIDKVVQ